MKKTIYIAASALVCSALLFSSCKKKEVEDNDTSGAGDHAFAETCSNDILNIGQQASYGQGSFNSNSATYKGSEWNIYNACAVLDFDTLLNTDADTLTVDFGTGCTGKDNRVRKGILRFVYTAGLHYRDSGNVINVSTPGSTYYVDGHQVIVNSKTITNKGHSTNGFLTWTINSDIDVNAANGAKLHWTTTNRTKVLLAGEMPNNQPIDWPNAKIAIYGDASGTYTKPNGTNHSFTVKVSQATWLVRDFTCGTNRRFFVAGTLEFTPDSKPTRYVNFGTGNCDNLAVVTINGHYYNVTLK